MLFYVIAGKNILINKYEMSFRLREIIQMITCQGSAIIFYLNEHKFTPIKSVCMCVWT